MAKSRGNKKGKKKGYKKGGERVNRPRFRKKRRPCRFCVDKKDTLDYREKSLVMKYLTDRGKIAPRRLTGCCARHQRVVAKAVKRARQMGLVPYAVD